MKLDEQDLRLFRDVFNRRFAREKRCLEDFTTKGGYLEQSANMISYQQATVDILKNIELLFEQELREKKNNDNKGGLKDEQSIKIHRI